MERKQVPYEMIYLQQLGHDFWKDVLLYMYTYIYKHNIHIPLSWIAQWVTLLGIPGQGRGQKESHWLGCHPG